MYKLGPEELKTIDALVTILPKLHMKNPVDGSFKYRTLNKRVQGKDLPKEYKKKNDWSPTGWYNIKVQEPILMNHKIRLIEEYKKHGYRGINNYNAKLEEFLKQLPDRVKPTIKKRFLNFFKNLFSSKKPLKLLTE